MLPPSRGRFWPSASVRALVPLALALAMALSGCRGTTEVGPPAATPTDMGGIALALQAAGVRIQDVVSGDAGCANADLARTAISFEASGLDQASPVAVHPYIFNDDAAYQRSRPAVDECARSFVTDPATYEALDRSPYAFVGQGPWGERFKAAVRVGLRAAAGAG